jgi:hypothetical protein
MIERRIVLVGYEKVKETYSDVERLLLEDVRDKRSLIFYFYMTFRWVRESYSVCCT